MSVLIRWPKRRLISDNTTEMPVKKRKQTFFPSLSPPRTTILRYHKNACARLETVGDNGEAETLFIYLDETLAIGRHPESDYIMNDVSVSRFHCKIYAIKAGSEDGGIIISCQVPGANGILWNDYRIRYGSSIILLHGDTIKIKLTEAYRKFTCYHTNAASDRNLLEQNHLPTKGVEPFLIQSHILGDGAHATVHLAIDNSTQRQVACKSIRITKQSASLKDLMNEVEVLSKLKHPNINGILHHVSTPNALHLFLELCTGSDLHAWLNARRRYSETESRYMAYQLALGLSYLHSSGIAHRDFKPENILLHAPGRFPRVMIADFGYSHPGETSGINAGTPSYMSPEMVQSLYDNRTVNGIIADCWSFGVVLFEIVTGVRPFEDRHDRPFNSWASTTPRSSEVILGYSGNVNASYEPSITSRFPQLSGALDARLAKRIVDDEPIFDSLWAGMSDAERLVKRLLLKNPIKRATIKNALRSSWFTAYVDSLEQRYKLHVSDPYLSATVKEN